MDDSPFASPQYNTPLGQEIEQNARKGREALFHWAVFPFPLALIPLAWGAQLPVLGFLFGFAAFAVLAVWAIRAYGAWGDRAWPFVAQVWEALFEKALIIVSRQTLRTYRFAGERAAHEEQARETTISLGLMAQAASDDPTQTRMATEIEHGAESRLEVLLSKPRLTIIEKGERDAIQRHLQARRAAFDAPATEAPAPRPMGFVSLAAPSLPIGWIVAALAVAIGLVQTVRVERVKGEARDLRDAVAAEMDARRAAETERNMNQAELESARNEVAVSRTLNETLERRETDLNRRLRESSRAQINAARTGSAVDLDDRLRDFTIQPLAGPDPGASPTPDPAGGMHERPAGTLDLSTPGALPTGDDGTGVGDSNVAR